MTSTRNSWLRSTLALFATSLLVSVAGVGGGMLTVPSPVLADHDAGVGCPHDHLTRTSSQCRQGVAGRKVCQGQGTRCQQQMQCNCTVDSATGAGFAAQDARTNFEAVLAANVVGPSLACSKLLALAPLIDGWIEALGAYGSSPACSDGAYVGSEFLRDVDMIVVDLPILQSLASSCGSSSLPSLLSVLSSELLNAQSCHLLGIPGQIRAE